MKRRMIVVLAMKKKTRENPSLENIREHSKYANNNRNYFGPKKNSSKASYKI